MSRIDCQAQGATTWRIDRDSPTALQFVGTTHRVTFFALLELARPSETKDSAFTGTLYIDACSVRETARRGVVPYVIADRITKTERI